MIEFKNEKGAALVLTLSIITLLLLFVMTMFYQTTNTTTQITTMEKNMDAKNIADMGIEYYQHYINNQDLQSVYDDNDDGINGLITEINNINKRHELINKNIDGNNRFFELAIEEIPPHPDDAEEIKYVITSIGTAFGRESIETSEITIKIESE